MAALSPILRGVQDGGLMFWCPGCDGAHVVWVGEGKGPRWGYNGDPAHPTFTPSVLVRGERWEPPVTSENIDQWREAPWAQTKVSTVCHSFVEAGNVRFLDDCTHALRGQTVPLPAFNDA